MSAAAPLSDFFSPVILTKEVPRLAVSADGMDKRGKTHWAIMTTPDPITVISNDPGTQHIIDKAVKGIGIPRPRKIAGVMFLEYDTPDPKTVSKSDVDRAQQALWVKLWDKYLGAMRALKSDTKSRTVVIDTHTAIYELGQLAKFGKLRGNKENQNLWAELNSEMHQAFWGLYRGRPDLNIVLIHKCKKEYKENSQGKDTWTGNFERASNRDVGFWVDVALMFDWDRNRKQFYTEVPPGQPVRFNPENVVGKRWYGEESAFSSVGMDTFPETELGPEIWGL